MKKPPSRMGRLVLWGTCVVAAGICAVVLVPKFKMGGLGSGQAHEVINVQMDAIVAKLTSVLAASQTRVQHLERQLAAQERLCSPGPDIRVSGAPDPVVKIDLRKMLGTEQYYGGVSFDVHHCGIPLEHLDSKITEPQLKQYILTLNQQMAEAMGKILGKSVGLNSSWMAEMQQKDETESVVADRMVRDPRTEQWRGNLTLVLSRWMVWVNKTMSLHCPESPALATLEQLGHPHCAHLAPQEVVRRVGYHSMPHLALDRMAHDALKWGVCTKSPEFVHGFGQWLREKRMYNPEWWTFNVPNLEQDAVVLLYDVLYESLGVFKKQYWLGTIAMQHPFDFLSISDPLPAVCRLLPTPADIIYTVQPDLIIETGTANGGSALMWASMMHLVGIENGRVLSLDISAPSWDAKDTHWGGIPRSDATAHPLWKKHVTFIKVKQAGRRAQEGDSADKAVYQQVLDAAQQAKKVLVLLDSNHAAVHVEREMELYCKLVTVDSYCIVEDMKLSRWSMDGPLKAVKGFLGKHGNQFEMDRERELVFTHHAMGYLKRTAA